MWSFIKLIVGEDDKLNDGVRESPGPLSGMDLQAGDVAVKGRLHNFI